ncbi:MAG: photosystem II repair protein Psb32 [Prochlorotrichaceae cyanobacterium]
MQFSSFFSPIQLFIHSRVRGLIPLLMGVVATLVLTLNWNIAAAHATSVYAIPRVAAGESTWIVDQADVLSRLTQSELQDKLEDLARQTGIELRLVTFRRLDYGDTTQTFVDKLFAAWFDESDRQADEALFALDVQTNYGSLHLGETAANLVNSETIASILDETMVAPLRDGNKYNQALIDVTDRLGAILKGEPDPGPPTIAANFQVDRTFASPEETKESNATTIVIVLLVIATIVPMLTYFAYVR